MSRERLFKSWISEYEKLIRHLINGFEQEPEIKEELFQEIALNVWQAIPKFQGKASAKTFIARISHNILATHVAKSVRTVKTSSASLDEENNLAASSGPYQELDKRQRQLRLSEAIRTLKIEYRQVLTLALEGMSYAEIAEVLMITTSLVGVRLQRAKVMLNQLLEAK